MNKKGQTLILFLFLLPILSFFFFAMYQIGTVQLERKKIEDAVETTVKYGIEHWSEETLEEDMLTMFQETFPTISDEDIVIERDIGQVTMTVKQEYDIAFVKTYTITISYTGIDRDGNIQIVKE